ncbi:MAG: hypothetical protein WED07_03200 [Candidatus Freyarchaeum deiterrae]
MEYSPESEFVLSLDRDIHNLIETGYNRKVDGSEFNDISLRLFLFQYHNNKPYRKYCDKKGITPSNVGNWEEIPAVASDSFKYADIACFPVERYERLFMTSGTSNPDQRGKIYRDGLNMRLFDSSSLVTFKEYELPDMEKIKMVLVSPPPELAPNSGFVYASDLEIRRFGTEESKFLISKDGMDMKTLLGSLKTAEKTGEPIIFGGASFGFVPFFDYCKKEGLKFNLPKGSRLSHGGGYKGRSREVQRTDFIEMASQILGIPEDNIINILGLTETASIFYDNTLKNRINGVSEPRYKPNHPWTRTVVVDPETLERLPRGEIGLLKHYDLANRSTVLAVQTDDIGYEVGDGFEILGRAAGSKPRGCSLGIEELIEANKTN